MTAVTSSGSQDQASLPAFRATLIGQAIAGLVFGLAPLLATAGYASALGFSGDDVLVYRLGGAATLGYFVAAAVALAWRASWREIRIPAIATITFTVGAFAASGVEFATGARQVIVPLVIGAGALFALIAAYWYRRDAGPQLDPGRTVGRNFRIVLGLATLSAGMFGVLPLLVPSLFTTVFGLAGTDAWIFRIAGASCLGYAVAGIASLLAPGYRLFRIQNFAAITFNGLGALSAWLAVFSGSGGWLAPVVAGAASFFTVALIAMDRSLST